MVPARSNVVLKLFMFSLFVVLGEFLLGELFDILYYSHIFFDRRTKGPSTVDLKPKNPKNVW